MKFSRSHEWIKIEGGVGTIGITEYAQKELGEVVHIELPSVGKHVLAGDEVAVLESTKAAADIYSPVSGEIIAINQSLIEFPDKINRSPEQEGWLFKVKLANLAEIDSLLDKKQYLNLISG
ncbi:MAG: glycine cleavage system protein GcvH [Chlamydiota bacterium]